MIKADGKLYIEDICAMIEDLERGIRYSIVDVFNEYFDIENLPSEMEDEK